MRVDAATIEELQSRIGLAVADDERIVIANHNLNSLALVRRHRKLQEFYQEAELVHIDGMSLIFMARLLGHRLEASRRVTYADWLPHILAKAEREGWRVYFLGGRPEMLVAAVARMRQAYPKLAFRAHDGYFDSTPDGAANRAVLAEIRDFRPHILMVGMGMPRQELWIHDHRPAIGANVVLPAGAALDLFSGTVRTPPRWLGRVGLEWAYRLLREPRRLWRRYLLEPWSLAVPLLNELAGQSFRGRSAGRPSGRRR
jgi:N-acetylglucosaminyldiphosphoundecaprenol N-acetyl-beta-D-mannosaminyltransferase